MFLTTFNFSYCCFNCIFRVISFIISLFHTVLPFGLDLSLVGLAAYYLTRLRKPDPLNVKSIFGPEPWSKESEKNPEKVVRCIAHRGALLDAPENTLAAFKYCVENACNFIELDVRSSRDGHLILLHDKGLERLAESSITDVRAVDWEGIKNIDVGSTHPNKSQFKDVHICLLDEALDYLLQHDVRVIIDIKGEDRQIINGILKTFAERPRLYKYAAVTCFNPFVLYQIRKRDPEIVGSISYRPYCFSAQNYDAETGCNTPRHGDNLALHAVLRGADYLHSVLWRLTAKWCNVSAVFLHKDIVSLQEMAYWRSLGVRCCGWSVNRPVEKLYWRQVLRAPYLANTLMGEPDLASEQKKDSETSATNPGPLVDKLLDRRMTSGQN